MVASNAGRFAGAAQTRPCYESSTKSQPMMVPPDECRRASDPWTIGVNVRWSSSTAKRRNLFFVIHLYECGGQEVERETNPHRCDRASVVHCPGLCSGQGFSEVSN